MIIDSNIDRLNFLKRDNYHQFVIILKSVYSHIRNCKHYAYILDTY